jgi:hypothetical protein
MLEDCRGGVRLKVLVVGDKLNDPVPDLCSDMIPRSRNELKNGIDIPLVLEFSTGMRSRQSQLTSVAKRSVKIAIFKTISSRRL